MNTRNLVAANQTKEKEVLIQALYPLSTLALTCKRAAYVGLELLLIDRPTRVENWLDHSITSWHACSSCVTCKLLFYRRHRPNPSGSLAVLPTIARLTPKCALPTKPVSRANFAYRASVSVDAAQHVITHIHADLADERDSRIYCP
jgi:hypothetical protein